MLYLRNFCQKVMFLYMALVRVDFTRRKTTTLTMATAPNFNCVKIEAKAGWYGDLLED